MSGQLGLQTHRGLRLVRQPKDQRRLGVQDRFSNLQEAMGYRSVDSISRTVVLVDDVVTTGATLLEAARAVHATGDIVAGFITFAQTRRVLDAKNLK
jgi:predicted amidophosphoribosyltransferase